MNDHVAPAPEPLPAGPELALARRLTLRYVLTAQAILAVAGALGIVIRDS